MAKKLYALLVGITKYDPTIALDNGAVIFPALSGCVNDANKLRSFLKKNYPDDALFLKELYNKQATKDRVCELFLDHLGLAGPEDSVLFYFSGHGTQEWADPCFFTGETDRKLESLVCFYDEDNFEGFLLADKELRYLIRTVAAKQAHLTIVVDCCHSGDVTRNAEILRVNYPQPVEKKSKGTYTFSLRDWEDFIFHPAISPDLIKTKGLNNVLPEGNHILFSASESNESAFEITDEGIFTRHFMENLEIARGSISNQLLFDQVKGYMEYAYVQKPRRYTPAGGQALRESGFLNAAGFSPTGGASVVYNQKRGWIMNRGEAHGIYEGLPPIEIFEAGPGSGSKSFTAEIEAIEIDHTFLQLPAGIDQDKVFFADVDHLARKPVRLRLDLDDAIPKDAAVLMNEINAMAASDVQLVSAEPDYSLQSLHGNYYIVRKEDRFRPISELATISEKDKIIKQLGHLARWGFLYDLSKRSKANTIPYSFLKIEYSLGGEEYKAFEGVAESNTLKIESWDTSREYPSTTLKIRITNKAPQDLYVMLLYLDISFASQTFLLEPSPYHLNQKDSVELNVNGDTEIPFELFPTAVFYNYENYTERFKLVVSTTPFETYAFKLDELSPPPLPGEGVPMGATEKRRGSISRQKPLHGWLACNIDLVAVNPSFNKIRDIDLSKMLDNKITAPFAEGLLFEKDGTQPFSEDARLRPGITVVGTRSAEVSEVQKSVLIDLANLWSRTKRNNYYKEITRRFPERTRIVAEGDSWFQHPLVYDTIDHLSKIYAIYCVSAAADTLSNYFSGAHKRGEFFLDILREKKPAFFLISGGGNDILGSQFRDFIVDNPYEKGLKNSTDGAVFFKESFGLQVDTLMNIYTTLFSLLRSEFPSMKTIVHGYDYPVHLDFPNKGWLGRYMIEKGIKQPGDRRTVIRHIIDVFNQRLGMVVAQFNGSVRYLDLRNTVLYKENEVDQWYDEIHPDKYGFQAVGLKFIKLIESLK